MTGRQQHSTPGAFRQQGPQRLHKRMVALVRWTGSNGPVDGEVIEISLRANLRISYGDTDDASDAIRPGVDCRVLVVVRWAADGGGPVAGDRAGKPRGDHRRLDHRTEVV